jgi:hypothetical protein
MATMGKYCKAYPLKRFREFSGWTENTQNVRKETQEIDGREIEIQRELTDDDILYLQENYIATDDIFIDENIIFDNVTPEWKDFCHQELHFEILVYDPVEIKTAEGENVE